MGSLGVSHLSVGVAVGRLIFKDGGVMNNLYCQPVTKGKTISRDQTSFQLLNDQPSLKFSFYLLQVLLTCPWSEQPPTEAPILEEEEEEGLEFDVDKVDEEEEEEVEVVEYEVVKEEEEDLWTKSMDEWAERQRSCAFKSTQTCQIFIVSFLVAFICTLK